MQEKLGNNRYGWWTANREFIWSGLKYKTNGLSSGGGRGGAKAPPTFRRQGQSPPINAFCDVISHNT